MADVNPTDCTTVPVRCPSCGQQTHKTLQTVVRDGGFVCSCGQRTDLDIEQFSAEIRRRDEKIKDFGRYG